MNKILFLIGFAVTLNLNAAMPYTAGENLVRNPAMKATKTSYAPDEWYRLTLPKEAKSTIVQEGDAWKIFFHPNQPVIDQARLGQFQVKTEPGNAYEFTFEAKAAPGVSLIRDTALLGTGIWCRFFQVPPLTNWTKCRQVFWIPKNVPEKGNVTLIVQNRSISPVWYRNVSLRKISISEPEVQEYSPDIKLLPVTPEDALVLPGSRKEYLQYVVSGIPEQVYDHFRFELRLYKNENNFVKGRVNGKRVEIPLREKPIGNSKIQLLVYDKRDNALIANCIQEIERIAKVPENLVDFDKIIPLKTPKGDNIFPIGVYAGLGWNFSLPKLKEYGFNLVHTYGTDSEQIREENKKLLQEAEQLGMWVMMGLPPRYQINESLLGAMTEWINAYKSYPAILAYYSDEVHSFRGANLDLVIKNYQTLKKADSTRPHYSYERPVYGLNKATDVLMIDLSSKNLAQVIKLRMGNIPVIHVYGQADYKNSTASSLEYNQYNFVMPFIWGASGILYYTLRNLELVEYNREYKILAPRVLNNVKRFSGIAPALISGEALPDWTKQIQTEGNMEHKAFALDGKIYIFCGVASGAQANGTIRFAIPSGKTLRDVLNDQALEANQELSITLHPGQGRIIEVK